MSDIRYNQWLHNSGTGGVSQDAGGNIGIGTTAPLIPVGAGNTTILNVGVVTANYIYGDGSNLTGITDQTVTLNNQANNRVITGTGATNTLNGEANLTFDGTQLVVQGGSGTQHMFRHSAGWGGVTSAGSAGGSGAGFSLANNYNGTLETKWSIYLDGSNDGLRFTANTPDQTSDEKLRITAAGDMGLGCSNPGADPAIGNDATVLEIRQTTSGNITSGNNRKGAVLRLKHEAQWENGYQSNNPNDDLGRVEFVTGDNSTGEGVRSVIRCRNLNYFNSQALTFEVATANSTSLQERLRITSAGNVGINEDSPTSQLVVKATTDDNPALQLYRQSTGGDIASILWKTGSGDQAKINYRGAAGANEGMQFYTAGGGSSQLRMIIDHSGKVGINRNDPAELLDVYGTIQCSGAGLKIDTHPIVSYASFTDISGGSYAARLGSTGTSTIRSTQIYGGGGHIATFDGVNNRLGISITAPTKKLDIATAASADGIRIKSTGNTYNELQFDANRTSANTHLGRIISSWNGTAVSYISMDAGSDTTNKDDGIIRFWTANGSGNFERMRITSDGKIGINDTTPSAYLDVTQGGIDSNVPGINIAMSGVGGGTAGEQYGLKITGGGYNNATHIYGLYVNKTAQLTQDNTAAYCRMQGTYATLTGVRGIAKCQDTGATGNTYAGYFTAQGDLGSAKNKNGYGIYAESTGVKFQLSCAAYLKTLAGASLIYGIIYNHAGSEKFRVDGAGGVWSANNSYGSDRDIKDNIVDLSGTSLDKIKQLTPRRFTWKLDDKVTQSDTLTGLIAQEVQPILPDIVTGTDGQKDMGINYNGLVAHLVNAVKELSAENEAMRARLDALESS